MKKFKLFILIILQAGWLHSLSQPNLQIIKTDLEPHRMRGWQRPFARNLSFANYQTSKIRRTLGSLNFFGTINPFNSILRIENIPLQYKERYRAKDVFRFKLNRDDGTVLTTECRAILKVREKFTLLRKQDSSFLGDKNEDLLLAVLVPDKNTADKWAFIASNLNATNDEPQKGKLIGMEDELSFELTNLVLRQNVNPQSTEPSFTGMDMVYAFTYRGEIVAAVSVKEADRKFWIKKELNKKIKDIVAAAAVILTTRQNLFRQKSYL
jgi:hypothetical protein